MQEWLTSGGEDPKRLPPLSLAFIGDAVYETLMRERILRGGARQVGELHRLAVACVCAKAQSRAYALLEGLLTDEETSILRRGRNCSAIRSPRSSSMMDYRRATAVEALFGYLYLSGQEDRLQQLARCAYEEFAKQAEGAGAVG